jgi:hypothetical protein
MEKLLFLDDYRDPIDCAKYMYITGVDCRVYHKNWSIVRSYGQFIEWINQNGLPDLISFDHDLGDVTQLKEQLDTKEWLDIENNYEYTGMDCAKWLVDYCLDNDLKCPDFIVHSSNPAGAENIKSLLNSFIKSY